jgi:hypothetical protein
MGKERLRGILIIMVLLGLCLGIILISVNTLRFHTVYRQGMNIIKNDPAVLELFGSPIREGLYVLGTTKELYDGGGSASLRVSLSGPLARGTASILGTQTGKNGPWDLVITIQVGEEDVLRYSSSDSGKGFQPLQAQPDGNAPLASPTPP